MRKINLGKLRCSTQSSSNGHSTSGSSTKNQSQATISSFFASKPCSRENNSAIPKSTVIGNPSGSKGAKVGLLKIPILRSGKGTRRWPNTPPNDFCRASRSRRYPSAAETCAYKVRGVGAELLACRTLQVLPVPASSVAHCCKFFPIPPCSLEGNPTS